MRLIEYGGTSKKIFRTKNKMGIMEWKINGNEAEKAIAKELTKPWYKKPEAWFSLVAAITGVIGLTIALR